MKKKVWIILLLVLLGGWMLWKSFEEEENYKVETEKAEKRTIISTIVESGTVAPKYEVPVSPDVSGEITELYVTEGDYVKSGQLLLTIKPDDYQAAYEEAKASLNSAKAQYENAKAGYLQAKHQYIQDSIEFERNKKLYEQEAISQQEYEQARLKHYVSQAQLLAAEQNQRSAYFRMINARATLKRAGTNLNKTRVYASQSGIITKLQVEKGQRVVGTGQMQGTEMMRISDMSEMIIEIEVNENDIIKIRLGNQARIEADAYPDKEFKGVVYEVAFAPKSQGGNNAANTSSDQVTTYPVKIKILPESYKNDKELPQNPLRSGMTGLVTIYTDTVENAIAVPMKALILNPKTQKEALYKYKNGIVKLTDVVPGIDDAEYIEIKKGISEGETIVTGPYDVITKKLRDSMKVELLKKGFKKKSNK